MKATKHKEKSAEIYSLFITVYTVGCIESGANTNKQKQTPFSQTNSFFLYYQLFFTHIKTAFVAINRQ